MTDAIRTWIEDDPDPITRTELTELLERSEAGDEAAAADLADRFSGSLEFGTAGLRGAIGGGPNRMNRAVVIRATAGLAAYLRETVGPDFSVAIGCDARHRSADFAADVSAVVAGAGGRALVLPPAGPTPVLAFAVRHLNADAGVMVTASHNPKDDNGYKVYLGGRAAPEEGRGVQIVPPADGQIAEKIAAVAKVADVPLGTEGITQLGGEVREAYLERAASLVPHGRAGALEIVHTAMHGVGGATALEAFARAGFAHVHSVAEQAEPDPDFPTVAFPNPEEAGALDLAFELAEKVTADLVIAHDPDADRCSVAVPTERGWRQLSGDEVGWLLGSQAAAYAALTDQPATLAASIVSSRMLAEIAAAHGHEYQSTLTGFKWISRVKGLAFGYEEALGYCVDPEYVRDKDGISAGLRIALLASQLANDGETLLDLLDRLEIAHGAHATLPHTIRVTDLAEIPVMTERLRSAPPAALGGSAVAETADLSQGWNGLPPTDAIYLLTELGDRVIVRPSGTEPKLKCYLESIQPVAAPQGPKDLADARAEAAARVRRVRDDIASVLAG